MTTESVIVSSSGYQLYPFVNGGDTLSLSPVEIEYVSENSSSPSYTDLSSVGMDTSSPSTASVSSPSCYPFLTIEEELKDQLRFRYKSEKGCHGGLKPIIKLHNCERSEDIWIKTTLYTCGKNATLHINELDGKDCKNGVGWKKLTKDFTAKFYSLSICMKKKDEIAEVLKGRIKQRYKEQKRRINEKDIEKDVQEEMKLFNLSSGMLCFEAFHNKDEQLPVCERIFSEPIYNQKCTLAGELKITRLSSFSGKASGGEDMILLCEKIRKDDIEIVFSCQNQNINWEEKAPFNPADVHHQVAIPFKTPKFIDNVEQEVLIRLCRKSDGKTGEPRTFLYRPCDDFDGKPLKRKRPNPPDDVSMPMSTSQSEPCTSTTNEDNILNNWNVFLSQFNLNPTNFGEIFENDDASLLTLPSLPFDDVTVEGILNLKSLNLSGNSSRQKADQKQTTKNSSNAEPVQTLKTGVINLLTGSEIFFRFLPALLAMKDEIGNTLLHLVVIEKSENLPLLIKMIEAAPIGLINQTNKAKMTPLHVAVSKGLWKVVRILLMFGANPDIKDKNGNTCSHLAAMYNLPWCLGEVLAPLLGDNKRKHLPNVNLLNYEGLAPLHLSVLNGSQICVKLLIQAKADINIPDGKCGKTPLHFAYEKNYDLVNLLRSQSGIIHYAEDFNGNAPNLYVSKVQKVLVSKPTECCIELSSESSYSTEDNLDDSKEEKCIISEKDIKKEKHIDQKSEDLFCKTLDSNKLWKKLGLYIMEEKELNAIEVMDTTPTKTLLNELKKQHGEKYHEKLMYILSDGELKEFAGLLIA